MSIKRRVERLEDSGSDVTGPIGFDVIYLCALTKGDESSEPEVALFGLGNESVCREEGEELQAFQARVSEVVKLHKETEAPI